MRLMGWSFNDGTAGNSLTMDSSVAAPAAGATIASLSLPNGTYTVAWTVELSGTLAAADIDNVALDIGATQVATSANAGAAGTYPQASAQVVVTGGPLTLAAKAIGAATAGSTYRVNATITPTSPSTATIQDGSGSLAFSAIQPGGVDNEWFGDSGIAVDTELRVLTTGGVVQGTVFYYISPERRYEDEQTPVQEN